MTKPHYLKVYDIYNDKFINWLTIIPVIVIRLLSPNSCVSYVVPAMSGNVVSRTEIKCCDFVRPKFHRSTWQTSEQESRRATNFAKRVITCECRNRCTPANDKTLICF